MTDYLNPHRIYPDDISRRIDVPPGFDGFRDTATDGKPHPDNGVPTVKESLTVDEAVECIIFDEDEFGETSLAIPTGDFSIKQSDFQYFIGDKQLNCNESWEWIQDAINQKYKRQPDPDSVRPAVKESLTTQPDLTDRIDKLEKEVEQLTKYFERFARFNRLGLPEVEG